MKKSELLNLIEDAKTIGIFGHIRPDGDCVGSCLGLYNYIQDNYDAEVTVYLEKIPGHLFQWRQNIRARRRTW